MDFAETAEPKLHSGQQVAQWHDRVEAEHDNLRAALDWSLTGGALEVGLRMVGALWEFWMNRGYASEGQTQAERFLARPETAAPTYARARTLHTAGVLAFYEGRHPVATALLTECIALSRGLGPAGQPVLAMALVALGYTSSALHNLASVQRLSEESLTLGRTLQDAWIEGHALQQLGIAEFYHGNFANAYRRYLEAFTCFQAVGQGVMCGSALGDAALALYEQGDYAAAQSYLRQSLTMYEEIGDKTRSSIALRQLCTLALAQDNVEEAQQLLTQAFLLVRETTNTPDLIQTLDVMGRLAQRQGDYMRAYELHQESLALSREIGYQALTADSLEAFACLAAVQGQAGRAATLFSAAEANHPVMGEQAPLFRIMRDPGLAAAHDRWVAHVRAELGADAADTAWATGRAMDLAQAVAYALAPKPLHQR